MSRWTTKLLLPDSFSPGDDMGCVVVVEDTVDDTDTVSPADTTVEEDTTRRKTYSRRRLGLGGRYPVDDMSSPEDGMSDDAMPEALKARY